MCPSRIFRSVAYKNALTLEKTPTNALNRYKIISADSYFITRGAPEACRIVISRHFQKKRKFSKHKRFQFILNYNKWLKDNAKQGNKPIIQDRYKYFANIIKLRFKKTQNIKKKNKSRMRFKKNFLIPITEKGAKSRMGKGKGAISYHTAKLSNNDSLFLLDRVSFLKAKKVFNKLRYKLGFPIKLKQY